eukprot:1145561-Pelagomonas_calceolata.AAC.6
MVIVDVAMSLEDPFDDAALDALSIFESLSHISAVRVPRSSQSSLSACFGACMSLGCFSQSHQSHLRGACPSAVTVIPRCMF